MKLRISGSDVREDEVIDFTGKSPAGSHNVCGSIQQGSGASPSSSMEKQSTGVMSSSDQIGESACAINCTSSHRPPTALSKPVRDLVSNSLSGSTKRAYAADMADFAASGRHIPSTPEAIAEYLSELVETRAVATIQRRLASISKAHRAIGVNDPTKAEIVKATMHGIKRLRGTAQREAKPLLREDLFAILERIGDDAKGIRDKALLLVGFAGAFRRSELVGLDLADIEQARQGIVIALLRSKTDQEGRGRKVGIPFGRTRWCPVKHLTDWLDHAGIEEGPIFRSVDRHGHIAGQRLHDNGRSPEPELPTEDEIDASFRRLRTKFRILLWMTSASLVMMIAIFIAVVWLERSI